MERHRRRDPNNMAPAPPREWSHSTGPKQNLTTSALRSTLFGQLLGAIACVCAIVAFMRFDRAVAYALVAAMLVLGAIAVARRVPLALWWTFGTVLGAVLGIWS